MKKTIWKVLSYVLVAVLAAGTTLTLCLGTVVNGSGKLQQLESLLTRYYIGEADEKTMTDAAASAMVEALDDRWSYYMTAEAYESYQDAMANSYVGVGITIQAREDQSGFDVIEVTPGAPAEEIGILAGDLLIAVDDQSLAGMVLSDVSPLVRGEEGTSVKLTVIREEQTLEFTVERRKFQTPVATYEMLEDHIGLITIENFDDRCADETITAIEALMEQGAKALIFDVRNNPGGYKHELVELLDYLLPEGPLFRTEDYRGREEVDYSDKNHVEMPMAVLVNLSSYSAAEFFAAALSEYDAAVVVGEQTYGKGYFQNTFRLSDGSAVNLSIGKYYTPNGVSLAGTGITPDVEEIVDAQTAAAIYAGTLEPEQDPQIIAAVNALKS